MFLLPMHIKGKTQRGEAKTLCSASAIKAQSTFDIIGAEREPQKVEISRTYLAYGISNALRAYKFPLLIGQIQI